MGDKSKICTTCGRWSDMGWRVIEELDTDNLPQVVWWVCLPCMEIEVADALEDRSKKLTDDD